MKFKFIQHRSKMIKISLCWVLILTLHNGKAAVKVEVANGKQTDQSSTENQGVSSRAVDGNTAGQFSSNSCTQTTIEDSPWWQVDLMTSRIVTDVVIYNRADPCCNSLLNKMEIRVGDSRANHGNDNPVCVNGESLAGQANGVFTCSSPLKGRFVNVRQEGRGKILSLCEVQVFAQTSNIVVTPTNAVPTTALIQTTTATSTVGTTTSAALPDRVEKIDADDVTSSSAIISWNPPRAGTPPVSSYYVSYRLKSKESEASGYRVRTVQGDRYYVKLTELGASRMYEVTVLVGNLERNSTSSKVKLFETLNASEGTPVPTVPLLKNDNFLRILALLLAAIMLLLLTIILLCCRRVHRKKKMADEEKNDCSNLKTLAKERGKHNRALELDDGSDSREYFIFNSRNNSENIATADVSLTVVSTDEIDHSKNHKKTQLERISEEEYHRRYRTIAMNGMAEHQKPEDCKVVTMNATGRLQTPQTDKAATLDKGAERRYPEISKTEHLEKTENRKYVIRQGRLLSLGSRPIRPITVARDPVNPDSKINLANTADHDGRERKNAIVECGEKEQWCDCVSIETNKTEFEGEAVVVCKRASDGCHQENEAEVEQCITKLLLDDLGVLSSSIRNFGFNADELVETANEPTCP